MGNKYKKWINFPESYRLVVGDTFELFYKGVILCGDPSRYNIKITCPKGAYFAKKYVYTPTEADVGEYTLTMEVSDDYGDVLDTASVILKVDAAAKSPTEEKYVLCVGDSLCSGGQWASEACRRLTASDGTPVGLGLENIRFVGTRKGQHGAGYEGYGGWRFNSYNSKFVTQWYIMYVYCDHDKTDEDRHSIYFDGETKWKIEEVEPGRLKLMIASYVKPLPESGTLTHLSGGMHHSDIVYTKTETASGNPFWNYDNETVDFVTYAARLGVPRFDICVVLLGWNHWRETMTQLKSEAVKFIEILRAQYPKCKIVLCGLQAPSQNGFGVNYGCLWNYVEKLGYVFDVDEVYRSLAKEYDDMYFVNIAGQFDTEHGFPTLERRVNERSEVTEVIQSNGVHPSNDGYMQIGDAVFRQLNAIFCEENG